jgi:type I restriction enzyme R subunit
MGAVSNFSFLSAQDERFARLGALAERYFFDDAPSTVKSLPTATPFWSAPLGVDSFMRQA